MGCKEESFGRPRGCRCVAEKALASNAVRPFSARMRSLRIESPLEWSVVRSSTLVGGVSGIDGWRR
jgi:hypothetical protein